MTEDLPDGGNDGVFFIEAPVPYRPVSAHEGDADGIVLGPGNADTINMLPPSCFHVNGQVERASFEHMLEGSEMG
jgi:hypothetical protein